MNRLAKTLTLSNASSWPALTKELLAQAWKWQKDITITILEGGETRRIKQNRLMWLWHGEMKIHILECEGKTFTSDDIHEWMAEKLLPKCVVAINDEPIITRTRTSKLSVKEFADFLTHYEQYAQETFNCKFTRPEYLYMDSIMRGAE